MIDCIGANIPNRGYKSKSPESSRLRNLNVGSLRLSLLTILFCMFLTSHRLFAIPVVRFSLRLRHDHGEPTRGSVTDISTPMIFQNLPFSTPLKNWPGQDPHAEDDDNEIITGEVRDVSQFVSRDNLPVEGKLEKEV